LEVTAQVFVLVHDLFQETSLSIEQQVHHAAVGKTFHSNRVLDVRLENGVKRSQQPPIVL
jgi:hypothetical protein